jgi:hypothetical protein
MTDRQCTSVRTLLRAAKLGRPDGRHYVYGGSIRGRWADSRILVPLVRQLLIERAGYHIRKTMGLPEATALVTAT